MGVTRASPLQRLETLRGELYGAFQKRERVFTVLLGLRFIDWYEIDLCAFALLGSMSLAQVDPINGDRRPVAVPMIDIARSFLYYSERTTFTYVNHCIYSMV